MAAALGLTMLMQLIMLMTISAATQPGSTACIRRCGDVEIPYPFGLTHECSMHTNFLLKCNNSTGNPTPLTSNNLTISTISVEHNEISILFDVTRDCYQESGVRVESENLAWLTTPSAIFTISSTKNKFTVLGCDSYSYLRGYQNNTEIYLKVCMSICKSFTDVPSDYCSGLGCCQTDVPQGLQNISVEAHSLEKHNETMDFNNCSYGFIVEEDQFKFSSGYLRNYRQQKVPLVLDWVVNNDACVKGPTEPFCSCGENSIRHFSNDGSGYYCKCKEGFQGNSYLSNGCLDINECDNPSLNTCSKTQYCVNKHGNYTCSCPSGFKGDGRRGGTGCYPVHEDQLPVIRIAIGVAIGFIALIITSTWIHLFLKQKKLMKLKEMFFRQNGGLILQQQLSQQEDSNQMAKIFTEEELKKATSNYDESAIIGRGGFGTVYKGILPDDRIVAIKKSKIVSQDQIEQFINEVVILSQINHRNVVKLLGCCLETQVPLLVYEFVTNGTLFEHIHNNYKASNLPLENRLRIAAETAGALSYLHSAASTPIIHRDVKPSNILLDSYMTAKVSDFGASKLVPVDQTEIATMVQGTLGYLDPEYLHTNQLTEKSDVYSFGVVLVELLTGQKALSFDRPEEERSLAMYFLTSLKEDRLFAAFESDIVNEGNMKEFKVAAEIAKRCLNVKGEDRPIMKEVAMELEGLRKTEKHPWDSADLNLEETESLVGAEISNSKAYYQETSINVYKNCDRSISNDDITQHFSGR